LDLVRVTEAAALAAARWMGLGNRDEANDAALHAMVQTLNTLDMAGTIVIGEEARVGEHTSLDAGERVGNGDGPEMDVIADPIDGATMVAQGRSGAISVIVVAPRGALWSPVPAAYMDKIAVGHDVAPFLVPECLGAPAGWTLALVARIKKKAIRDLVVFVLDRPRHAALIDEIRTAGARVMLRTDGDIGGALMAADPRTGVDLMMGIGGASEGVVAACAVKALRGAMLARLAPQTEPERAALEQAHLDTRKILTCDEMVTSREVFFAATGITTGVLLRGVRFESDRRETDSLILRGETGTRRLLRTEFPPQDERAL